MEDIEPLSEEETDRIEAEYQARKAAGTLPVISPERDKRQLEFVLRLVEEERARKEKLDLILIGLHFGIPSERLKQKGTDYPSN